MHNPLEDKYAITELIARYNQSLDCGDYKTWMTRWSLYLPNTTRGKLPR